MGVHAHAHTRRPAQKIRIFRQHKDIIIITMTPDGDTTWRRSSSSNTIFFPHRDNVIISRLLAYYNAFITTRAYGRKMKKRKKFTILMVFMRNTLSWPKRRENTLRGQAILNVNDIHFSYLFLHFSPLVLKRRPIRTRCRLNAVKYTVICIKYIYNYVINTANVFRILEK